MQRECTQNALQRELEISHLQTDMGFVEDFHYSFTIDKNTFSAPFGIFYVKTKI